MEGTVQFAEASISTLGTHIHLDAKFLQTAMIALTLSSRGKVGKAWYHLSRAVT